MLAAEFLHHLERALDDAADSGLADEHVMRFLGQHELTGAGQRIEPALGQALELELAVAVGEIGEHEEDEPVAHRLVEGAEDARLVGIAGMALQQLLGLLAPVAAEIGVQEIDHRPEMAALLDIDLEEVAQIVERRAAMAQQALLFDGGRLGVALGDDQTPQRRAVLARHLLPGRLAVLVAKTDAAIGHGVGEEDAPAIVRHLDRAVARPALGIDRGRRPEIDVGGEEIARPHRAPPIQEMRLPMLQGALQCLVAGEVDVVGDELLIIDGHLSLSSATCRNAPEMDAPQWHGEEKEGLNHEGHEGFLFRRFAPLTLLRALRVLRGESNSSACLCGERLFRTSAQTLSQLNCALLPDPKSLRAPCSPTALGRLKIQFCQAERRPKILVSIVSAPAKRRLASMPVRASGDRLARSSTAARIPPSPFASSP